MDSEPKTHLLPEQVELVEALLRDPEHLCVQVLDVHDVLGHGRHGRDHFGAHDAY